MTMHQARRAVIFDIDGTLADPGHRLHHVKNGNRDWDAFFAAMDRDPPVAPLIDLLQLIDESGRELDIIICTGRPEKYRGVTEAWLTRHGATWSQLHMRPDGDRTQDHLLKGRMLARILADGYEIEFVVDDRPSVVAMWRERGLVCLQCRDWVEDAPTAPPARITLMVGPSGAGKTTWLNYQIWDAVPGAADHYGIHASHIVSSDQIRHDLCGDFRDQTKNDQVFAALHAVVKARLRAGLPAVIDATNLRRKDRMACVELAPPGCRVRYIVIDRPLEEKRRDGGWRNGIMGADGKPFDLIARHDQTFRSQIKDILAGDGLGIEVVDLRR